MNKIRPERRGRCFIGAVSPFSALSVCHIKGKIQCAVTSCSRAVPPAGAGGLDPAPRLCSGFQPGGGLGALRSLQAGSKPPTACSSCISLPAPRLSVTVGTGHSEGDRHVGHPSRTRPLSSPLSSPLRAGSGGPWRRSFSAPGRRTRGHTLSGPCWGLQAPSTLSPKPASWDGSPPSSPRLGTAHASPWGVPIIRESTDTRAKPGRGLRSLGGQGLSPC